MEDELLDAVVPLPCHRPGPEQTGAVQQIENLEAYFHWQIDGCLLPSPVLLPSFDDCDCHLDFV